MSSIRGVMLLPIRARSYRSHAAHHAFINKVNAPETVADPNLALSRLVENRVRGEVAPKEPTSAGSAHADPEEDKGRPQVVRRSDALNSISHALWGTLVSSSSTSVRR